MGKHFIEVGDSVHPPELVRLSNKIQRLIAAKEQAVSEQDFEKATSFRDQASRRQEEHDQLLEKWREKYLRIRGVVDAKIAQALPPG